MSLPPCRKNKQYGSHAAGIDFAWARYGFGHHVSGAEHTIDSITQLCDIVAPLK